MSDEAFSMNLDGGRRDDSRGEGSSAGVHSAPAVPAPTRREKRKRTSPPEDEFVNTPWKDLLPKDKEYYSVEQKLHDEIMAYVQYVQPTAEETVARERVLRMIEKTVKKRFYKAEVKMFGSSATGLCLPTGDMDIVVAMPTVPDKKRTLFQLSAQLKAARLTCNVLVNHHARVPILTMVTLPEYGCLSVDMGVNNTDGLLGVELVKDYLSSMPALRPLFLVAKGFLSRRGLNDASTSGLGSYALILMCISFLQTNPSKRPSAYFTSPFEEESLGALFTDFLFYYGLEFPYATSYISVKHGKVLLKANAPWIATKGDALVVECIINPEVDIAKSAGKISSIRKAFKEAYAKILQLSPADGAGVGGLLRWFVGMNQATLDHRAHLQRLVSSSELESTGSRVYGVSKPPTQQPRQSLVRTQPVLTPHPINGPTSPHILPDAGNSNANTKPIPTGPKADSLPAKLKAGSIPAASTMPSRLKNLPPEHSANSHSHPKIPTKPAHRSLPANPTPPIVGRSPAAASKSVPFGMAFGSGSIMGRGGIRLDGQAVRRKGSGFADASMSSSSPSSLSTSASVSGEENSSSSANTGKDGSGFGERERERRPAAFAEAERDLRMGSSKRKKARCLKIDKGTGQAETQTHGKDSSADMAASGDSEKVERNPTLLASPDESWRRHPDSDLESEEEGTKRRKVDLILNY